MQSDFKDELKRSMDALHFSNEVKERMTQKLIQYQSKNKKGDNNIMNKLTFPKAAAVAAACLLVTGGTAFAASKISMYTASSNGNYDYSSIAEMNDAASDVGGGQSVATPEFPEVLGGYTFDGGNKVNVAGKDDNGNTIGKWEDFSAVYKDADGAIVNMDVSCKLPEDEERTPTQTRSIGGITVAYNHDEYLFLPPEMEGSLDPEIEKRAETDEHFFVSYGSSEEETVFFSGVSFVKDSISYNIFTMEDISADALFDMAEELINR